MEDSHKCLEEYGIEDGVWTDEVANLKERLNEDLPGDSDETNPESKGFKPYKLVARILKDLDIDDFESGKIVLSKSLEDSLVERERLVRDHFNTYFRCRTLLEDMAGIKKELDHTKALAQIEKLTKLEGVLLPVIRENREIDIKEKQQLFIRQNRILFEGPAILEEHLTLRDFDAFLSDFAEAKAIADRYKNSKFIAYYWSQFTRVLTMFKTEISKRIETSQSITECLHYFNTYLHVDPESASHIFGTLLVVAKKEFYQHHEQLSRHQEHSRLYPEKSIIHFIGALLEKFSFMIRSLEAVDLLYNQDKHTTEFISSGIEAFAHTAAQGVDLLFSEYEKNSSVHNANLLTTINTILKKIKEFAKKNKRDTATDIYTHYHLSSFYTRLITLLFSQAHHMPIKNLLELITQAEAMFASTKELFKSIKKTIKQIISKTETQSPEEALKTILLLKYNIIPQVTTLLKLDSTDPNTNLELPDTTQSETQIMSTVAATLKKDLTRAHSDEHFLMIILRVKVALILPDINTANTLTQILKLALQDHQPTPTQLFYLPQIFPNTPKPDHPITSATKQFQFLLDTS
ncbi:hypothetical protein NEHOM01_0625 [Nematocida homosporus]|uniref:uncharacterized protein n=1 Tax=Nematocida homosporus TaxID=1912981 RepID=UPI00221EFCB9|nr:uncharacterized protein NEHOM01_0625 [Nematocida homosporus]KAI5185120.1 hypothetical protein NEHOM01_0625 [Nematocida homosporus]